MMHWCHLAGRKAQQSQRQRNKPRGLSVLGVTAFPLPMEQSGGTPASHHIREEKQSLSPLQVSRPRQKRFPVLFLRSITGQLQAESLEAGRQWRSSGAKIQRAGAERSADNRIKLTTSVFTTLSSDYKIGIFSSVLLNPLSESTSFVCDYRENSKSALSSPPILRGATKCLSTFLCKHYQSNSPELSSPAVSGRQLAAITTGLLKKDVLKGEILLFHSPSAIKELMRLSL